MKNISCNRIKTGSQEQTNFVKYMLENMIKSIRIIVLDKLTYAGILKIYKRKQILKSRLCKRRYLQQRIGGRYIFRYEIDYVVNFAAESHVDRSISNPQIFLETNILGINKTCWKHLRNSGVQEEMKMDITVYKERSVYIS